MLKNEKGYTLVLVIIMMAVLCIVGSTLISRAGYSVQESAHDIEKQRAKYIADSALNATVWKLENYNQDSSTLTDTVSDVSTFLAKLPAYPDKLTSSRQFISISSLDKKTNNVGQGTYWVDISRTLNGDIKVISHGKYHNSEAIRSAVLKISYTDGMFNNGIAFATTRMDAQGPHITISQGDFLIRHATTHLSDQTIKNIDVANIYFYSNPNKIKIEDCKVGSLIIKNDEEGCESIPVEISHGNNINELGISGNINKLGVSNSNIATMNLNMNYVSTDPPIDLLGGPNIGKLNIVEPTLGNEYNYRIQGATIDDFWIRKTNPGSIYFQSDNYINNMYLNIEHSTGTARLHVEADKTIQNMYLNVCSSNNLEIGRSYNIQDINWHSNIPLDGEKDYGIATYTSIPNSITSTLEHMNINNKIPYGDYKKAEWTIGADVKWEDIASFVDPRISESSPYVITQTHDKYTEYVNEDEKIHVIHCLSHLDVEASDTDESTDQKYVIKTNDGESDPDAYYVFVGSNESLGEANFLIRLTDAKTIENFYIICPRSDVNFVALPEKLTGAFLLGKMNITG